MQLRDYQLEIVANVQPGEICCLPTGTGKSAIIAAIAQKYTSMGLTVVVIVPTIDLIHQTTAVLLKFGLSVGIASRLMVYCYKTASIRGITADVYLHDECHHSASDTWQTILQRAGIHIGFTATPVRLDGKPLEGFDRILEPKPFRWFQDNGYLVQRIDELTLPQITEADITDEDALESQFLRLNHRYIYSEVIAMYQQHGDHRQGVVFCTTIKHAELTARRFNAANISACAVHSEMSKKDRAEILRLYKAGSITILTNVTLLTEGIDAPSTAVILMLRHTGSIGLYCQMIGRGTRPGKPSLTVLDFVGNTTRHGSVQSISSWDEWFQQQKEVRVKADNVLICPICRTPINYGGKCSCIDPVEPVLIKLSRLPQELKGNLETYGLSPFEQTLIRSKKCNIDKLVSFLSKARCQMTGHDDEDKLIAHLAARMSRPLAEMLYNKIMR